MKSLSVPSTSSLVTNASPMGVHTDDKSVNESKFVKKSKSFIQNSHVEFLSTESIQHLVTVIRGLDLKRVYELYHSGKSIGSGCFGEVRVNQDEPWLVIKHISNLKVIDSTSHYLRNPIELLVEEEKLFQRYYGTDTSRLFLYNYQELSQHTQNTDVSFFSNRQAFIVMLRIPGKNAYALRTFDTYLKWILKVGNIQELSPRQIYLQLLSYLQDKGIHIFDFHLNNMLFDIEQKESLPSLYPIDLSDFSKVNQKFDKRLHLLLPKIENLMQVRLQIEKQVGKGNLHDLSFDIFVVNILKKEYTVSELCTHFRFQDHKGLSPLEEKFIELIIDLNNQLSEEEKDNQYFVNAIEYTVDNIYFFLLNLETLSKYEQINTESVKNRDSRQNLRTKRGKYKKSSLEWLNKQIKGILGLVLNR